MWPLSASRKTLTFDNLTLKYLDVAVLCFGLCTQLCTVTGLILRSKLHYFAQSVTVQICTSPLETTWLSSLYLTSWTYIFESYSLEILLDFGKRDFFSPHHSHAFDPEIKASQLCAEKARVPESVQRPIFIILVFSF